MKRSLISALAITCGALAAGPRAFACAVCATADPTIVASGEEQPFRGRLRLAADARIGRVDAGDVSLDDRRVEIATTWAPIRALEILNRGSSFISASSTSRLHCAESHVRLRDARRRRAPRHDARIRIARRVRPKTIRFDRRTQISNGTDRKRSERGGRAALVRSSTRMRIDRADARRVLFCEPRGVVFVCECVALLAVSSSRRTARRRLRARVVSRAVPTAIEIRGPHRRLCASRRERKSHSVDGRSKLRRVHRLRHERLAFSPTEDLVVTIGAFLPVVEALRGTHHESAIGALTVAYDF